MNRRMIKFRLLAVNSLPHITRLMTEFQFPVVRRQNLLFDMISAFNTDWMGDIRMQFGSPRTVVVHQMPVFIEPPTAMVAEAGAQMVFLAAAPASVRQL